MTAYAYSDTDDVTEKANIDRAAVERLERDPYGSIAMTDEERRRMIDDLRRCKSSWLEDVANEIERLARENEEMKKELAWLQFRLYEEVE
jgi:hypothetical protein